MKNYYIKISSFSFGAPGTDASEYTLPSADLTGTLEVNLDYVDFAILSEVSVPSDTDSDAKKALGLETGQLSPATYSQVAIKFTTPSGKRFWFPNCGLRTATTTVCFTVHVYKEPSGEKWCAEIDGERKDFQGNTRLEFAKQDLISAV